MEEPPVEPVKEEAVQPPPEDLPEQTIAEEAQDDARLEIPLDVDSPLTVQETGAHLGFLL
jgi:hypothetical protein